MEMTSCAVSLRTSTQSTSVQELLASGSTAAEMAVAEEEAGGVAAAAEASASAAMVAHSILCCLKCLRWQSTLQYHTNLQRAHRLRSSGTGLAAASSDVAAGAASSDVRRQHAQ